MDVRDAAASRRTAAASLSLHGRRY